MRHTMSTWLTWGCAVALATGSLIASARQQQAPPPTFRGRVDLVSVDVTVLDESRRPVRDLTAADFTVTEDGKRRPIVVFSRVDLPPPPAGGSAAWTRTVASDISSNDVPGEGRLVVIVFDWSILFETQQAARQIARAAVEQLAPGDLASIVFTSAYANGGVPQNFTADRERLLRAIDRPFAAPLQGNGQIKDVFGRESGECYCRLCIPEQLSQIVATLRDVPKRRKVMLFIGTTFQAYSANECAGPLRESRERLIGSARLANLTIHTVDPRGLQVKEDPDPGLRFLADETGGRSVFFTNAPETFVGGLLDESSSYYVLGIEPADPESAGRRHDLDVRVDRPHVTVHARNAYITPRAPAGESSPSAVRARLDGVLPQDGLPLAIGVAPLADVGEGKAGLLVVLRGALVPAGNAAGGQSRLTIAAFSPKGRFVTAIDATLSRDQMPAGAAGEAQYTARLALEPGSYEIRAAAEIDDAWGSVFTFADVPDFDDLPLSASGILFGTLTSATASGPIPNLPVQPTLQRTFQRTEEPAAFLRIYARQASEQRPVRVDADVVDDGGRQIWSNRTDLASSRFDESGYADVVYRLPLRAWHPGDYLLMAHAVAGDHEVSRSVRFAVR